MEQFHLLSDYGSVEAPYKPGRKRAWVCVWVFDTADLKKHTSSETLMVPPFTPKMTSLPPPCERMKKTNASNWLWSFAANSRAVDLMSSTVRSCLTYTSESRCWKRARSLPSSTSAPSWQRKAEWYIVDYEAYSMWAATHRVAAFI